MFESLSDKLTGAFNRLSGKGRLSEEDIDAALREVRLALLEADVDFKVARQFVQAVRDRAVDEKVFSSLTPGQTVVKIVHEELAKVLAGAAAAPGPTPAGARPPPEAVVPPPGTLAAAVEKQPLLRRGETAPSVIMLVGLQGAGKTTLAAKLGLRLKREGRQGRAAPTVMLAACDLRRPAAIDQLVQLGAQLDIPVHHEEPEGNDPVAVARRAVEEARRQDAHWLIIDTSGRLHIDDSLMHELEQVRDAVQPVETLLVVDAMTGQDAVRSGSEFHRRIGLSGIVITKMDGDARGGAALSMRSVTGLPVKFMGTGEKPDALEEFHPDRIASRILGMGDVQTLIERAQEDLDAGQARKLEARLRKNQFDMNDLLDQFRAIKKMGPLTDILGMIPGMGGLRLKNAMNQVDDRQMARVEAIILSMTPAERANPKLINGSRRKRIADGSGNTVAQVNTLLNQFIQMQKVMKKIASPGGKRAMLGMMRGLR